VEFIGVREVVLNGLFDNAFNVLFARCFVMRIVVMKVFVMRLFLLRFLNIFSLNMSNGGENNTPTKAKKTVALAFILFGISSLGIKAMQN
jgi:hypothetical protein